MSAYTLTLQTIASLTGIATSTSLIIAYRQFRLATRHSQTAFEDALSREYRQVAGRLPLRALMGEDLGAQELDAALPHFYWYFDLTNEQVFLRRNGRVSDLTWRSWVQGVEANMSRPAFRRAWAEIERSPVRPFAELRRLVRSGFRTDPSCWSEADDRPEHEPEPGFAQAQCDGFLAATRAAPAPGRSIEEQREPRTPSAVRAVGAT